MPALIEGLESRTFFSVSPALQADLDAITAAKTQSHTDAVALKQTIVADRKQIVADLGVTRLQIRGMYAQLRLDALDQRKQLIAAAKALLSGTTTDRAAIFQDLKQIVLDRGNPTAVLNDRAQLKTDLLKLRSDILDNRASYKALVTNLRAAYRAELAQIIAARKAGNPDVLTDTDKLKSDRAAGLAQLVADRGAIIAAITKYRADRKAGL